mgnify:CR=1 FL=1
MKEVIETKNSEYYFDWWRNCSRYPDLEQFNKDGAKAIIRMLESAKKFIDKIELDLIVFH